MARKLLEFECSSGPILVAVDEVDPDIEQIPRHRTGHGIEQNGDRDEIGRVGKNGEPWASQKFNRTFDAVTDVIIRGCQPLCRAFERLNQESEAKSAEVEFGITFTASGSIYLVESSSEATLKVKITWDFAAKP